MKTIGSGFRKKETMMEYRLLTAEDAAALCRFVDDQQTLYEPESVISFLQREGCYGFVAADDKIVGFAYGYVLPRPDGKKDFYLHAMDIAMEMQGMGHGTKLVRFINHWRKQNGCRKMFLITNQSNQAACRCYRNAGGNAPAEDDVVYVFE